MAKEEEKKEVAAVLDIPIFAIEPVTGVRFEHVDYNCKAPMKSWLFGYPVSHSLSPLLHNRVYKNLGLEGWAYTLFESTSISSFLSLLADPTFLGASVTMPHKISILPHLDLLSPACKAIGACNTIVPRPGSGKHSPTRIFIGVNTDCAGIREALMRGLSERGEAYVEDVKNGGIGTRKPALVIGGGGTTRSSVYALWTWMGAGPIYVLNRFEEETKAVIEQFRPCGVEVIAVSPDSDITSLPHFHFLIGCIPDLPPSIPSETSLRALTHQILAYRQPPTGGVLLDMCYKPRWTTLLQKAKENGWVCVEGIECMIEQGIEQEVFWTGFGRGEMGGEELGEMVRRADEVAQLKG